METHFTVADVIQHLQDAMDAEGGIRPWCENRNIHPSVVDKFLAGQRGPSPQLLAALGLEPVTLYRKAIAGRGPTRVDRRALRYKQDGAIE
jgi:hypothetical protein